MPLFPAIFGFGKGFNYFKNFLSKRKNKNLIKELYAKIFDMVAKRGKKWLFYTLRNFLMFLWKEELFRSWESYYNLILKWINKTS